MKATPQLLLVLTLFTFGCSSGEGPYEPAERQPGPELEFTTVILDEELKELIAVDDQDSERTKQGRLKTMSNVRNRTNQDLTVQVQTVFRDESGFSIGDDTSWDTIVLTANETRTISATSTSKKAERFTVRVRMMR